MSAPRLFDLVNAELGDDFIETFHVLPYAGRTPESRQRSHEAAIAAAASRGKATARYLAWLQRGPSSDHAAAAGLGLPLSSINSIRNSVAHLVTTEGAERGPHGRMVTRWRLLDV